METVQDPIQVINTLQRRIDNLEHQLRSEQLAQRETVAEGVANALRRLRLHSVISLYVGDRNIEALRQEIATTSPELFDAIEQFWLLEEAPVGCDVKNAMRAASVNGMTRW